jgi:RNA polymerase sigma factor (sigma-70 family)
MNLSCDLQASQTFMNRFSSASRNNSATIAIVQHALERQLAGDGGSRFTPSPQLTARVMATVEKHCLSHTPEASADEIAAFIARLRLAELSLVVRCETGDEESWRELIKRFTPTVRSAARAACTGEAEAEELASSVWAELYGLRAATVESGDEEVRNSKGKLGYYSGCGSLGGWLRAIVAQLATDRYRKTRRLVQCEDTAELERIEYRREQDGHAASDGNRFGAFQSSPEQILAKHETGNLLQYALRRAIGELTAEDQLLLKLYYVDELRLREAGAVLGFHEATASRRLGTLHRRIRERITEFLVAENNLKAEEVAALFAEGATNSDSDIRALLQTGEASN